MSKEFKRTDWMRSFKLGKARRKVAWRRARGVHSKIRRKRMGYPVKPTVGYRSPRAQAGLVDGKRVTLVRNLSELALVPKGNAVILARVGAKKKLDMIKKAEQMQIKIINMGGKK